MKVIDHPHALATLPPGINPSTHSVGLGPIAGLDVWRREAVAYARI